MIIEEEILQKDISGSCPIDRIHVTTELHWEGYLELICGDFWTLTNQLIGLIVKIFLKSLENGKCSNAIAKALKEKYEFTFVGNLTILKSPQFFDDLSQISELYTAFQGSTSILFFLIINFYVKYSYNNSS